MDPCNVSALASRGLTSVIPGEEKPETGRGMPALLISRSGSEQVRVGSQRLLDPGADRARRGQKTYPSSQDSRSTIATVQRAAHTALPPSSSIFTCHTWLLFPACTGVPMAVKTLPARLGLR